MMKKITFLLILLTMSFGYAQPTTNAATPTKLAGDVISVYSDAYTNIATNYNPFWGQSGTVNTTYDPTGGGTNFAMAYTNFDYQGTDLTATNASAMEFLHVDLWTAAIPANSIIQVSPINHGTGPTEVLVTINYTSGTWTSVDIPKSSFTGMTWDNVDQFKFAANGAGSTVPIDIYVDNVYFWKAAANPTTDATLSDLQVDGVTISGFSSATTSYTYAVPAGTTVVPQITSVTATQAGNGSSATSITQASAIPGDATVLVTAPDGTTTMTYTVSIVAVGPPTAAPTPPNRNASDVISMFSGPYTDIPSINWNPGWSGGISTVTTEQIQGDDVFKVVAGADVYFAGDASATTHMDLSTFEFMHFDYWTEDASVGQVLNPKLSQWDGGAAEAAAYTYTNPIGDTSGLWVPVDIALTDFLNPTTGLYDVAQVVFQCNTSILYIDNIYFYKGTPLSTKDFAIEGLNVYPNPAQDAWNIKTKNINMSSIEVFDILGKSVMSLKPEATEATINASQLKSGLYFAKISTANGSSSLKLVKQ